jgi:hypothetical protein
VTRHFAIVVGAVLGAVPQTETRLRARLKSLAASSRYTAPEAMQARWIYLEQVLVEEIGEPTEGWHRAIVEIVQGRTKQEPQPLGPPGPGELREPGGLW